MAGLGAKARKVGDVLDSAGNTTKAICKGFAIGAAALAALAMFSAYAEVTGTLDVLQSSVFVGLFIGAMLSFLFCSFLIQAVSNAAFRMIEEVRRQFRQIPGLREGKAKPDYATCVGISTNAALKGLILPGLVSVATPIVVGFVLGAQAVGGLLAGNIASALPLALLLAHTGTAWDNAKKFIEAGNLGGKGSATHKSAVIGDTIGDPFKDTAGPSLDILMDVMAIVAILFAQQFIAYALL
jgi:K(+)-stimulated pyrophosphate-energized sodium pump